jgi:hypothetical protein
VEVHRYQIKRTDGAQSSVLFSNDAAASGKLRFVPDKRQHAPGVDIRSPNPGQIFYIGPGGTVSVTASALVTGAAGGTVSATITDGTNYWGPTNTVPGSETTPYQFGWSAQIPAADYVLRVEATVSPNTTSQSISIAVAAHPPKSRWASFWRSLVGKG